MDDVIRRECAILKLMASYLYQRIGLLWLLGSLGACAHATEAEPASHSFGSIDGGTDSPDADNDTATPPQDTGAPTECGNGVVEADEECDNGDLGGHSCKTEHFAGGNLACTPSCTLDTSGCDQCGDGTIQAPEECDGADLGNKTTCADVGLGKADELLTCTAECKYDMSACSGCGDGTIEPPEECEPHSGPQGKPDLGGKTCTDIGWQGGSLGCNESCRFDESGCSTCGDNKKTGAEECDGADFGSKTCSDFNASNGSPFNSGTLSCTSSCKMDTSNCMLCGDGKATGNETCDGSDLKGTTCEQLNFTGGTLTCQSNCSGFNTSACTLCGNGKIEGAEQCDGTNLNHKDCFDLGFIGGGSLACSSTCTFDTSGCTNNTCGDGVVNGNDECDCGSTPSNCSAGQLANKTCLDFTSPNGAPYSGGSLSCNSPSNCTFDTSGCEYCGDGTRNSTEECDNSDMGGKTCKALGFHSGTLSCSSGCTFDTSACVTLPNPLRVCRTPNADIPDNDPTGVTDMLSIAESKTIDNVDVKLDIPHTWVGDVSAFLTHGSVTVTLLDRPGVPADSVGCHIHDIDTWLKDNASTTAEDTCNSTVPALDGNLRPNQPLSAFDGQDMSGTWALRVTDSAPLDTGILRTWCVEISWH